jgi:MFS family permease
MAIALVISISPRKDTPRRIEAVKVCESISAPQFVYKYLRKLLLRGSPNFMSSDDLESASEPAAKADRHAIGGADDSALTSIAGDQAVAVQVAPTTVAMPEVLRALRNRDFRLFWFGNFLSNVGTWMQNVAESWLVLQLAPNNSAFWLGVLGFATTAPMMVFALIGGVIADRVDRRKLMTWTQSSMMVLAFTIWGLTVTKHINIPLMILLSFCNGLAMSLNAPTYQAIVPSLVPREDLTNAIALNSAQFNMSRVIGPTLGGLAMAWFGLSNNFLLNALSFVAVLIALMKITYPPVYPPGDMTMWETMSEGFTYLFSRREMLMLTVLVAFASILGIPYATFVPLFAKDILHLNETGFGLLMASSGTGAFLGAATIAVMKNIECRGRFVVYSALAFYTGIIFFALSRNFALSAFLLGFIGYCMILMVATVNSLLQHLSTDKMRGRVMSIYATAFLGFAPIGSLLAGSLAGTIGAPHTIAIMAAIALIASAILFFRSEDLQNLN